MKWKNWGIGAINAIVSGAAGAVGGLAVGVSWKQALEIAAISGFVSLSKWMIQHPLPGSNGSDASSAANPAAGKTGK